MGQDGHQPLNAETDDWVFSSGVSLGALLKNQREKKGLSHAQISRETRLRPHILEAIENEDWKSLPTPTLAKGFIRAYARALALDEDRIVDLYKEAAGDNHFSEKFVLPSIHRKNRWPFIIGGLLVLLVALTGFYAWIKHSTDPKAGADPKATHVQNSLKNEKVTVPDEQQKSRTGPFDEKKPISEVEAELTADVSAVNLDTKETPESLSPAPETTPTQIPAQNATENEAEVKSPSASEAVETFKLLLKGHVTERTWVRISIDGLKPKEFTFSPSDKPEWKAKKGFELLIGNAGGIVLEFNGKKMDNLGKQGQVIRIKLPEDEERSTPKD